MRRKEKLPAHPGTPDPTLRADILFSRLCQRALALTDTPLAPQLQELADAAGERYLSPAALAKYQARILRG